MGAYVRFHRLPTFSVDAPESRPGTLYTGCPCLRLAAPISQFFALPTFPDHRLFLCPMNNFDRASRWYRYLAERLLAFKSTGRSLVEENNVILFPLTIPFDSFLPLSEAADLALLHNEILSSVRKACLAGVEERPGHIERALEGIQLLFKAFSRLQPGRGTPADALEQNHLFREAQDGCFDHFHHCLERLLHCGASHWLEIQTLADSRQCALGRLLHSDEEGGVVSFRHVTPVRQLMDRHRSFHEEAFVRAQTASALRSRALTCTQIPGVERDLNRLLGEQREAWEGLTRMIAPALHGVGNRRGGACAFAVEGAPRRLPFVEVVQDLERWEEQFRACAQGRNGVALERRLPPAGTLLGGRLALILEDHASFRAHAVSLQRLYGSNVKMHGTAVKLYTLAHSGEERQALNMVDGLHRERMDLLEMAEEMAEVLNLAV